MFEFIDTFQYKFRIFAVGILVIASILILPFLPHLLWVSSTVQAANKAGSVDSVKSMPVDDNPNVISTGMFKAAHDIGQAASSVEQTVTNSVHSVTQSVAMASVQSGKFVVHSVGSASVFTVKAVGNGLKFTIQLPGKTFGLITKVPSAKSIIRPADNRSPIPVIDGSGYVLAKKQVSLVAVKSSTPTTSKSPVGSGPSWPMHGEVTLEFGVPHWPYQPTHTGIDISDGQSSGITPIKPFESGVVIAAMNSNSGFGNHIIIDHGGGLTSLYGHLASISVRVGQQVDKTTILGYEGTTGESTGPHLHFETDLNGQPVNPRQYISGQP